MIENVKKMKVKYNGKIVGYLAEIEPSVFGFQYEESWLKDGFSISPFSLPLCNKIFISPKKQFGGLYGVFWDSLPDGWGELLMNRMLVKRGINPERLSPLTKLSLVNDNGLGGLSYEPNQPMTAGFDEIPFDTIAKEVEEILKDNDNVKDLDSIYRLGGSSGGARPKVHVRINEEPWIIKFACAIDPIDVGEKEYKANELAEKCGIRMNEYKLFTSKICAGYFGSKRFDREGEKRLHVISLAALLEISHRQPVLDYGHLFNVVESLNGNKEEMYETFRRMCFNVYYGNKDDHAKNFAFIYDENLKRYRISPAYDITRTPDKFEHEMTINGKGNPSDTDLLALAKDFNLSPKRCEEIMQEIKDKTI